jgi:hypothetical protein
VPENIDQIGKADAALRQVVAKLGQEIGDPAAVLDFIGVDDGGHESTTMKNWVSAIVSKKTISYTSVRPYIWAGRRNPQWYIQVRCTAVQ